MQIDNRRHRRCIVARDAWIYLSYIDACTHVPLHMHETRRERIGSYTEHSRNISRWKKSRVIHAKIQQKRAKGETHDSICGRDPKATGIFSSWSKALQWRATVKLFVRDYFKDIPCTRYTRSPTYHGASDSAAAYFFTRSDRFDVSVIDAPPLTLRENRINQRHRAASRRLKARWYSSTNVASAAINRIRDRQFTHISRRTHEIPTYTLSRICIQHSM